MLRMTLPPWRRVSTLRRLMLLNALIFGIVLTVVLVQVVRSYTTRYLHTINADLAEEIPEYVRAAALRPATESLPSFSRKYLATHQLPEGRVLLVRTFPGPALGTAGATTLTGSTVVRSLLASPPTHAVLIKVSAKHFSYQILASPIILSHRTVGVLVAGANLDDLAVQRARVVYSSLLEAAMALAGGLLISYIALRRLLRDVSRVTRAATEISQGDLTRRLSYDGPDDEVGRLSRTFDQMLDRISAGFDAQARLLSDVSHQLRTPLTAIRGQLEVLSRGRLDNPKEVTDTVNTVLEQVDHLGHLVEELLLLGRSLEPGFIEAHPVDLRTFLGDLLSAAQVLAPRVWHLNAIPDKVVMVDGEKLRGALWNLIDNAVNATSPADSIVVSAECNDRLVLSVADTGRGLTSQEQAIAFERFKRPGSQARGTSGSGLGLALVKAVAVGHGGTVEMESAPGDGCTVRIVLPGSCIVTDDNVISEVG